MRSILPAKLIMAYRLRIATCSIRGADATFHDACIVELDLNSGAGHSARAGAPGRFRAGLVGDGESRPVYG